MTVWTKTLALFALSFAASVAAAQRADPVPVVAGPLLGPVTTEHRAAINGASIPYLATFREYELKSADGRPQATISATSYVRTDAGPAATRPVFFFFNGGPGASSSPLHFTAFGPRLRPPGRHLAPFTDNPDSLLDVADLVFVDPVGTGFSRVLPGGDGAPFWSPSGDAAAVLLLIRNWLRDNGRTESPLFIAGESYGGFRLATMVRDAAGLNLRGLLMISPATSMAGLAGAAPDDKRYVFSLPTMAVAAWHHEKIDRRARTAEQFYDEAVRFAENDYLVALHQGAALPEAERRRIAEQMASFIGLTPDAIMAADLRVSDDLFVDSLLRDSHRLVGRLDTRVAAPVQPPARQDRPAAANDPSLGLGTTNVILSPPITQYMDEELGVRPGRDYVSLTLDVNFRWNWLEPAEDRVRLYNPLRNIADAMAARPALRLMVAGGLYDLAVPVAGARYAVRHADVPLERVHFLALPAGHSPFDEPPVRNRFANEVRAFVASALR